MAMGDYDVLMAKTRAMYGKLLKREDYNELLKQKSVGDVVYYLKHNTYYGNILTDVNEGEIHRGQFEKILRKSLMNDYDKLFCFTHGKIRDFLKVIYLRHEIDSLKRLLRVLETKGTTSTAEESLIFLKNYDPLHIAKLATVQNIRELINELKGTPYYDVLRPFLNEKDGDNLFMIEMSLDLYYVNMVFSKKKTLLSGLDAETVTRSLGTEIDILNLLWIYRGRIIYNMDRSIVLSYLIPHRYRLPMDLIYELVDATDKDAFMQITAQSRYSELFLSEDSRFYDLKFSEYMYDFHRRMLRNYGFSIASAISYLYLKEYEISNIVSIIEGIRYGMPVETIRSFIVGM
ncbi:ATP synthase subunit C [Thermoclostridium stercorarium subsp. leptospartum DSM 9219]|uniref:ATP synthase subunit C n=2 Tax=Thermoclostridium stercorarium TaxID=1510 RepID=A0A1B1YNG6_THEST|nr:ATP synthase subunit C [Thermoclostridium stercorarium subsp. leptospartum DSM 9219]